MHTYTFTDTHARVHTSSGTLLLSNINELTVAGVEESLSCRASVAALSLREDLGDVLYNVCVYERMFCVCVLIQCYTQL